MARGRAPSTILRMVPLPVPGRIYGAVQQDFDAGGDGGVRGGARRRGAGRGGRRPGGGGAFDALLAARAGRAPRRGLGRGGGQEPLSIAGGARAGGEAGEAAADPVRCRPPRALPRMARPDLPHDRGGRRGGRAPLGRLSADRPRPRVRARLQGGAGTRLCAARRAARAGAQGKDGTAAEADRGGGHADRGFRRGAQADEALGAAEAAAEAGRDRTAATAKLRRGDGGACATIRATGGSRT